MPSITPSRWKQEASITRFGQKGFSLPCVVAYSAIFVLITFVILLTYVCAGFEPLWKIDGLEQFLPYFIYTGDLIRDFLNRLLTGQDVSALLWNQSNGYGSDAIAVNDTLWNPLNWISALIPARYAEYGMVVTIVARLYLAGLFFLLYCLYRGKGRFATLCGSLLYAFSATALEVLIWPGGSDPLVLFPLLLLGAEKVFDRKSPLLFIASVFLFFFISYYYSFAACIFLVIYCAVRVVMKTHAAGERVTVRLFGGWVVRFIGYTLIGIACAAISLAPQLVALMDVDRAFDARSALAPIYSPNNYISWFAGFVGHSSAGSDCSIGYTGAALVAVVVMLVDFKQHRELAITFIAMVVCLCLPAAGAFFNGLNYATNRWVWAFAFCIAYILVEAIPEIERIEKRTIKIVCIVCAAYGLAIMLIPATRNETNFAALCGLALFLAASIVAPRLSEFTRRAFLLCALVVCLALGGYYFSAARVGGSAGDAVCLGTAYQRLSTDSPNSVVAEINDDSWWRYDADPKTPRDSWVRTRNSSLVLGLRGFDFYNSIYDSRIDDYHTELGITGNGMNFSYDNVGGRSMLLLLNNVKYFLKQDDGSMNRTFNYDDKTRVAYSDVVCGVSCSAVEGNTVLPLGYTYDTEISRSTYESLSPLQKQQALMQGAVVGDEEAQDCALPQASLDFSDVDIPFNIVSSTGVRIENGAFVVEYPDASITLTVEGVPASETYLEMTGLTYKALSPYDLMSEEKKAALDWAEKTEDEIAELQFDGPKYYWINVSSDQNTGMRTIANYIETMHVYGGKTDWDLCLGYSDEAPRTIAISFSAPGRFSYSSLSVKAQPMASYCNQAAQLGAYSMSDTFVDGGHVSGTIDLDAPKRVFFGIPWSQGWKAYVDGQEMEIDLTNTAFMSLALDAGFHTIELRYVTPGLGLGALVSVCCIVVLCVVLTVRKRSSRRCAAERRFLRQEKIEARETLTVEERAKASKEICNRVLRSNEFSSANTILLYRAVRGEVQLDVLIQAAEKAGKRIVYPHCISKDEMCAYVPNRPDAWEVGRFGIMEPIPEQSTLILPGEIDLVVCPCSSFDKQGNRLGMGAGYYDRFLASCLRASVVAVAFEAQKAACVPVQQWDFPMSCVFTEEKEYR